MNEKSEKLRVAVFLGDLLACFTYRLKNPHNCLSDRVEIQYYPFLPNMPGQNDLQVLVDMLLNIRLVIVQRCYVHGIVARLKYVCDFLGIPLIFETDDDYINLPYHNPAYLAMIPKEKLAGASPAEIGKLRDEAVEEYKKIIGMADLVTVSTEELKQTLYPYNRNIEVLPNQMERIWERRDHNSEDSCIDKDPSSETYGQLVIKPVHRLWSVPDYFVRENRPMQSPRIGYSATLTHRGADFNTVSYYLEKLIQQYDSKVWWVYLGDKFFWEWHESVVKSKNSSRRNILIPSSEYDLYMFNLRNLDIAIAPLECNIFNMSKSEIKGLEAACWGIPSVLPDYVTYNRTFVHGETALLYKNGKEFKECIEALVGDPALRHKLGKAAQELVYTSRLESQHTDRRYNIYKELVEGSYRLRIHTPNKEKEDGLQQLQAAGQTSSI